MTSSLEKAMEAEDAIIQQCARLWGPRNALAQAHRLMVRAEKNQRQANEIVALMKPEKK